MQENKHKFSRFFFSRFNALDIVTFAYVLFSSIYILLFFDKIDDPLLLLSFRTLFVSVIILLAYWDSHIKTRFSSFLRVVFPVALTVYWYPETSLLNHGVLVPNLDAFFNNLEFNLFGSFPVISFSKKIPYAWFSEIMYFAYFSFYLFYNYIILSLFIKNSPDFLRSTFTLLSSFLIFYVLFIFIPVEGPIFYYPVADRYVPEGYVFSTLMRFIQEVGERPTAAFPSSHVAMTIIFLIEIYRYKRKAFYIGLPIAILLFMSTVYIKAHYLVDVIGGFIAAPIVYYLAQKLYRLIEKKTDKYRTKA